MSPILPPRELPSWLPVFPLPDVVLFPGAVLPLHVFEPRYREMVRDALRGAGVIAMALLRPGWEENYEGVPEVHDVGCAGVIEDVVRTLDGRYYFQLRAVSRVRFTSWSMDRPYRVAEVAALPEDLPDDADAAVTAEKLRLLGTYAALLQEIHPGSVSSLGMDPEMPAHLVVNRICMGLDFDAQVKQKLLEMNEVLGRGVFLAELMDAELRRALREKKRTEAVASSGEN